MTSSSSALGARVQRSRHSSPEQGLPSCFWTRTGFGAISFYRRIPSIRLPGHHKEFVIGDGITEALLQARSLASAIARGTDAALGRWWRARDVEALPYFYLGRDEGALGPPMRLHQVVCSHVAKTPGLQARMAATMEHQLSPFATFPVRKVLWWTLGAAFRGSLGVLPDFIALARRGSAANRELRLRLRLLADAEGCEARATKARREAGEANASDPGSR